MNKIISILLFSIVLSLSTKDIYDDSWALIIGIDKYKNTSSLDYAVEDASSIGNILKENFNFTSKKSSCLKCFYQSEPSDEILNCETEGIFGSTANIIGSIQANEILKAILNIGNNLKSNILILDLLNLNFRKVLYKKRKNCIC